MECPLLFTFLLIVSLRPNRVFVSHEELVLLWSVTTATRVFLLIKQNRIVHYT